MGGERMSTSFRRRRQVGSGRWPVVLLGALLLVSGCVSRRQRISVGGSDEIVVWADPATWEIYGPSLAEIWQRIVWTPRDEQVFTLRRVDLESWGGLFNRYRNLVLCAALDSGTPAATMIRQFISPEAQQGIRDRGEGVHFIREDIWARDQLILIITAPDAPRLLDYLQRNRSELWQLMEERYNQRVSRLLFRQGEEFGLERRLYRDWGFVMRVPWDYRLDDSRGPESFVRMINYVPERLFFAWWAPLDSLEARGLGWLRQVEEIGRRRAEGREPDPEELARFGQEAMILRDAVTREFYDRDAVVRERTTAGVVDFGGRWALRLYGLWKNDEKVVGGALVAYCFLDPASRRIWWLDGALFAPEMTRKEIYVRRLDMLLRTFMTGDEADRYMADPRGAARAER
jgi:hypothetical protein